MALSSFAFVVALTLSLPQEAQKPPAAAPSPLAAAAAAAAKKEPAKKPAKVYTNNNLIPDDAPVPPATKPAATSDDATEAGSSAKATKAEQAGAGEPERGEAYWRERMRILQTRLDDHVMQRQEAARRVEVLTADEQSTLGATRILVQRELLAASSDLSRLGVSVEIDRRAIRDLEDEARRAGALPGWLRIDARR